MTDPAYTAYSYLTAGEDFPPFELAPEFGRVPAYAAALTAGDAERAAALLRGSLVVSLHDHPVRFPAQMEETPEYNRTGRQHAAYAGLAASGVTVMFDNMMDGTACVTGNAPWRWDDIITDLGMRQADLAHAPGMMTVRTVADIDEAYRSGRTGWASGSRRPPHRERADRLDILYGLGIRQIGIGASDANTLGSGLERARRRRADLVRETGRAADEPARAGHRPVPFLRPDGAGHQRGHQRTAFITHAGARAVWDSPRMKPDDVLRAVAGTGGVIGMSAAPHTTLSHDHPAHTIESVMDHSGTARTWLAWSAWRWDRRRCTGTSRAAPGVRVPARHRRAASRPRVQPGRLRGRAGEPHRVLGNICGWLVGHGYSDDEIRAVLGGTSTGSSSRSGWGHEHPREPGQPGRRSGNSSAASTSRSSTPSIRSPPPSWACPGSTPWSPTPAGRARPGRRADRRGRAAAAGHRPRPAGRRGPDRRRGPRPPGRGRAVGPGTGTMGGRGSAGGYVSPAARLLQSVPSALLRDPPAVHGYLERLRGLPAFLDAVAARYRQAAAEGRSGPGRPPGHRSARRAPGPGPGRRRAGHRGPPRHRGRCCRPRAGGGHRRGPGPAGPPAAARLPAPRPAAGGPARRPGGHLLRARRGGGLPGRRPAPPTTSLAPEEIHRTGLDCLAALRDEWAGLGGRVLGVGSPPRILARLREDPALRFTGTGQIVRAVTGALAGAEAARDRGSPGQDP